MDQQLLVFLKVAEHLSFSRAAEALHVSQPAVSQNIVNLESSLNAKLFDRTNKSVQLTKAGEIVLHYGKQIMTLYAEMEQLTDDLLRDNSGPLAIGSSYTYGEYILPHTLARFRAKFPRVTPSVIIANTHDIEARVASGELDIGIVEGNVSLDHIQVKKFASDELVIIMSAHHPLATKSEVRIEDLEKQTWIVREHGSGTREITDVALSLHHIDPASKMEFGSTQVIKEAVEAGLGIALLSVSTIRKERELGTLHIARLPNAKITRDFSIITRQSEFATKAMNLFYEFICTASAESTSMPG
ncbi:LysR family transcriptional regulator [Alicyclobacillus fastidiosus]|uniref:LysR family transcriptional regulator n=1 Tax=Alicyclobacillus fastidiosus TaxID=392011 RepID=A0ABY6ZIT2_9BACL|nr:LysR family transcriptional regulator [Alicyclobacillus fastidiosus]WAH42685.1 LysR family transcriptional regulator [Alicyclobacillus fastidiosus]GMA64569.1 LysR family transcriptional regulator [Alicyclobacillus fastidiosus]